MVDLLFSFDSPTNKGIISAYLSQREKDKKMLVIEWQTALIILAMVVAVIALVLWARNRKKFVDSLDEMEKYLEKSVEKIKETSLQVQERFSSADALIQKQHNDLLQHLILLSKFTGENKIENQNAISKHLMQSKVYEEIAQIIAQKVLDEIKKKW